MTETAVSIKNLLHRYGQREAVKSVSLEIHSREILGLLGPNGSGKTTLFKILSTSLVPTAGSVKIFNFNLQDQKAEIRKKIGVVFQAPSLDTKLSVYENLIHQGHLYGISGKTLSKKVDEMMSRLGISDRAKDITGKLSGGLKRRVELAKGLLHNPELVILDEPSTGLDPGARADLWKYLKILRDEQKVTVLVTTHLMEEADHCDRIAIMNAGVILKVGTPESLKLGLGADLLLIKAAQAKILASKIESKFPVKPVISEGIIEIEHAQAAAFLPKLVEAFPGEIESITFRKPTLEDVFMHETGHRFWAEA